MLPYYYFLKTHHPSCYFRAEGREGRCERLENLILEYTASRGL